MFDSIALVFSYLWSLYASQMPVLLGFAALFTFLTLFESQASTPGKYWWNNPGLGTDVTYFVLHSALASYFRLPVMLMFVFFLQQSMSPAEIDDYFRNGRGPLSALPFWAQVVVYLLATDFLLYWSHRIFHRTPQLWPFHAIHHSAQQVDWTTSLRFHPINLMFASSGVMGLMLCLGIRPEVIALVAPFDAFLAVWQHANSKWTLGPFKYVIATPVFHRWHHTLPEEGGDMNFAPTFPFWDYMFGTFYMPEGKLPQVFGTDDPELKDGYLDHLIYPFKPFIRRLNSPPETEAAPKPPSA